MFKTAQAKKEMHEQERVLRLILKQELLVQGLRRILDALQQMQAELVVMKQHPEDCKNRQTVHLLLTESPLTE
jgi:ribosomal protein L7Ae-like RNA K-turn-binding protein